jgi:hypothetical protein
MLQASILVSTYCKLLVLQTWIDNTLQIYILDFYQQGNVLEKIKTFLVAKDLQFFKYLKNKK